MPFETALSGIRAASNDLSVTGNNIANASTKGFKSSRAEFGDVYATSVVGAGNNPIGSGVRLQNVAQQFSQGSVSFTENELDLAVNGNGFFVVKSAGEQFYSRAGSFGMDQNGYVVNNTGARLQGFPADTAGNITGLQNDIRIQTGNLAPRSTSGVQSVLNLDASQKVLQSDGLRFQTQGNAIGVTRSGLQESTTTTVRSPNNFNLPLATNFTSETIAFDIEMTASSGNNGTVSIRLNSAAGVPATITSFNDLRTLAGVINSQSFSPIAPQRPVDVVATAVSNPDGSYALEFAALEEGEGSQIRLVNGSANAAALGLPVGPTTATSTPGIAAVSNGYPAQSLEIVNPNGSVVSYTAEKGASAASIASQLNEFTGVSATASTNVQLRANSYQNSGNMLVSVNGVTVRGNNLVELGQAINGLSTSSLRGISAQINPATGDLGLTSSVGDDIEIAISGDNGDRLEVIGNPDAPSETLQVGSSDPDLIAEGRSVVVGGAIEITLAEGYRAQNPVPASIGLFSSLTDNAFTPVTLNEFDPANPATYNSATSMTIFDSLGKPHVLSQYFVRQKHDPADPSSVPNHWMMYVQIDGQDVGDPNTTLPPPANTLPTRAGFDVHFNENGSINQALSDSVLISNWYPRDPSGNPSGALGPQNVLAGGNSNIPDPPTSSNFVIDMAGSTQFGDNFSVNDVGQNGFPAGRLSGLNIDDSGIIFARFTNGESKVLGQLVLADFANTKGLQPVGNTMWAENYESGPPNIGVPGSGALGAIQAGALEESNVDLSEQLVNLIIAQRNFQASAKTIETANQVTQTIINLR